MLVGLPMRPDMKAHGRRGQRSVAAIVLAIAVSGTPGVAQSQVASIKPDVAALARIPIVDSSSLRSVVSNLAGRSGKLLARFVAPPRSLEIPVLKENLTYTSRAIPQIQQISGASPIGQFSLITMRSFRDKIAGHVGSYRIGYWPDERGRTMSPEYEAPAGFIEVTPENQHTWVSQHFQLKDFLTHDQKQVWPKYLVLREDLLDKLELVIQELKDHGVPVRNVSVLSGFRTPQYNLALGDRSGRARDSRHQYGDAADIYVDNNGDGRMDDLNGDGRVNMADTRVVLAAVERVERKYPDLVGGVGLYHSTGSHGPFAHIDVRGSKARWVNSARVARSGKRKSRKSTVSSKAKSKKVASSRTSGSKGK
jgi:uncharacterized protein YcbK (DUF882 family)